MSIGSLRGTANIATRIESAAGTEPGGAVWTIAILFVLKFAFL